MYSYSHDCPSRRYATGAAAQGISSRHLEQLVDSVIEVDIRNCMFTIVVQLSDMLGIYQTGDATMDLHLGFPSFRACAKDRDAVLGGLASQIGMSAAKQLNLEVAGVSNYGSPSRAESSRLVFQRFCRANPECFVDIVFVELGLLAFQFRNQLLELADLDVLERDLALEHGEFILGLRRLRPHQHAGVSHWP